MKTILILLIFILISGCTSTGNDFNSNAVSKFQRGITTEQEVYSALGSPLSVSTNSNGQKILVYYTMDVDVDAATYIPIVGIFAGGANSESKTLTVTIDNSSGLVSDWYLNETSSRTDL